jgi:hypothetical protein
MILLLFGYRGKEEVTVAAGVATAVEEETHIGVQEERPAEQGAHEEIDQKVTGPCHFSLVSRELCRKLGIAPSEEGNLLVAVLLNMMEETKVTLRQRLDSWERSPSIN